MKIFVTGSAGYIGSHLVELLKAAGHVVTGCDLGLFDGCRFSPFSVPDRVLKQDLRTLTVDDLRYHDCVMHLGAISNDPMGKLNPDLTLSVNRDGSLHVARCAKLAGVPRFLFASSCSIYGKAGDKPIDEEGETLPLSAYAQSKIEAEQLIRQLADDTFCPVYLRNATAYGLSPMLRIDLVLNNLIASALSYGEIRVQSDGSPWRPLIHCRDIARAFIAFLEAPRDKVFNRAINVGAENENYQVRDVANTVKRCLPETSLVFTGEVGADPRNYRVSFDLLSQQLPAFSLAHNLHQGADELCAALQHARFSSKDFESARYVRTKTLQGRLHLLDQVPAARVAAG